MFFLVSHLLDSYIFFSSCFALCFLSLNYHYSIINQTCCDVSLPLCEGVCVCVCVCLWEWLYMYVCVCVCVLFSFGSLCLLPLEELRFRQEECRRPVLVIVTEVLLNVRLDRVVQMLGHAPILVILVDVHLAKAREENKIKFKIKPDTPWDVVQLGGHTTGGRQKSWIPHIFSYLLTFRLTGQFFRRLIRNISSQVLEDTFRLS